MRKSIIAALAALSLATPALAKNEDPVFVVASPVKDKPGPVALSPTMGYLMLRSDVAVPLYLMKLPTKDDQAAYDKMRADALIKAHAKYVKKQKEYDDAVKANADLPKDAPRAQLPDKPIEPTEANFEFIAFPQLAAVSIGPMNRFAKADGGPSTYVEELTPGEYRIYGPLFAAPNGGVAGTCFCMGSVAFTAKAGEVVDLGVIAARANAPGKRPEGDSSAPLLSSGQFVVPASADMVLDPRLSGVKVVPAKFRPVGKLPNYYGVAVARIPAMPGVMRYDRDRIVDLTAGN